MAKYRDDQIPPGATKPIGQMTLDEYRSWRGSRGGSSRSQKKLRALRKSAASKKPGLKTFHALVRRIAGERLFDVEAIKGLATEDYPIGGLKAVTLLNAARNYAERNPIK